MAILARLFRFKSKTEPFIQYAHVGNLTRLRVELLVTENGVWWRWGEHFSWAGAYSSRSRALRDAERCAKISETLYADTFDYPGDPAVTINVEPGGIKQ